jgi:hypothetical protein
LAHLAHAVHVQGVPARRRRTPLVWRRRRAGRVWSGARAVVGAAVRRGMGDRQLSAGMSGEAVTTTGAALEPACGGIARWVGDGAVRPGRASRVRPTQRLTRARSRSVGGLEIVPRVVDAMLHRCVGTCRHGSRSAGRPELALLLGEQAGLRQVGDENFRVDGRRLPAAGMASRAQSVRSHMARARAAQRSRQSTWRLFLHGAQAFHLGCRTTPPESVTAAPEAAAYATPESAAPSVSVELRWYLPAPTTTVTGLVAARAAACARARVAKGALVEPLPLVSEPLVETCITVAATAEAAARGFRVAAAAA